MSTCPHCQLPVVLGNEDLGLLSIWKRGRFRAFICDAFPIDASIEKRPVKFAIPLISAATGHIALVTAPIV